jgi:hypothetical protein
MQGNEELCEDGSPQVSADRLVRDALSRAKATLTPSTTPTPTRTPRAAYDPEPAERRYDTERRYEARRLTHAIHLGMQRRNSPEGLARMATRLLCRAWPAPQLCTPGSPPGAAVRLHWVAWRRARQTLSAQTAQAGSSLTAGTRALGAAHARARCTGG